MRQHSVFYCSGTDIMLEKWAYEAHFYISNPVEQHVGCLM